jgi:hypothetical protein
MAGFSRCGLFLLFLNSTHFLPFALVAHALEPAAVRGFHQTHPAREVFSPKQCGTCHPAGAEYSAPLNRNHCEQCHAPELYEGNQPRYAQRAPESCVWCHSRTGNMRNTLHESSGHRACTSCHNDQHRDPMPSRQSCTTCHQDKVNHIPKAKVCYGCHGFTNAREPTDPAGHGAPIAPAPHYIERADSSSAP